MRQIKQILFILLVIIGLASCATSKKSTIGKQNVTQKAQISLTLDQHKFDMSCQLKAWKTNSLYYQYYL